MRTLVNCLTLLAGWPKTLKIKKILENLPAKKFWQNSRNKKKSEQDFATSNSSTLFSFGMLMKITIGNNEIKIELTAHHAEC